MASTCHAKQHRISFSGEPQQAGQQTKGVDGRELWVLAERYEVYGIKPWLVQHAITVENVCAAAHFACMCAEGVFSIVNSKFISTTRRRLSK
jgi:hypothetical protein